MSRKIAAPLLRVNVASTSIDALTNAEEEIFYTRPLLYV